ncbi:hypothetical protein [Brumimicrobium aurantiacum]|uniref:hypothetical protein n=1 Tax=Brumimicrobium aurantiacum TaxID=1737063 RepID=UPI000F4ECAB0|nr:hypothetical protein [Brumimicrobium aurantiacum]
MKNTSAVDKVVAFSPALMLGMTTSALKGKVAGIDGFITKDGAIESDEGTAITGLADPDGGTSGVLTSSSMNSASPIEYMMNYVASNPTRVVRMNLQSNQKEQFSTVIEQSVISPFERSNGAMSINLRDYVTAGQFQNDRVEIPLLAKGKVLTLASDVVILFKLKANSAMQINWDIGVGFSASHILRRRGAIANAHILAAGQRLQTK